MTCFINKLYGCGTDRLVTHLLRKYDIKFFFQIVYVKNTLIIHITVVVTTTNQSWLKLQVCHHVLLGIDFLQSSHFSLTKSRNGDKYIFF